jgi:hypothetical protein
MNRTAVSVAMLATCCLVSLAIAAPHKNMAAVDQRNPDFIGNAGHGGSGGGGGICAKAAAGSDCQLDYNCGTLLAQVKLFTIYYTAAAATADRAEYADFYASIVQSTYFDWIREYDSGSYKLRRGTYIGDYVDMTPNTMPAQGSLDDSQIGPYLQALLAATPSLPQPDANTLYMIHFPPGVTITQGGHSSCNGGDQYFCAYHSGAAASGQVGTVRYSVIPYLGDNGCTQGCGGGTGKVSPDTEVTASHEIMEAVTDADVWSGSNSKLGWYDQSGNGTGTGQCPGSGAGEVGDICNGDVASVGKYKVQKIWSNKQNGCIAVDSTVKIADYALALDKAMVTGDIGSTAMAKVTATPVTGSATDMLTLTVTGLPMGVTAAFAPASIATNATSALTFTIPAGTMVGSYPFTVSGASMLDNVIHTINGTLMVQMPPPPDMARPIVHDMAQPVNNGNGGNGGNGGGGNGGNGGGNGNGDNNGGVGRGSAGGCSIATGVAANGAWILGLVFVVAFIARRRRA